MNLDKELKEYKKSVEYAIDAHTLEAYYALPESERTRKVWWCATPWYRIPYALPMDDFFDESEAGGWNEFHRWCKNNYPLQYFVRNWDDEIALARWMKRKKYAWTMDYWYPFTCLFKPRNKELRKVVPRTYAQPADLIEQFLFTALIAQIEGGFYGETIDERITEFEQNLANHEAEPYDWAGELEKLKMMREIYYWAKNGRATWEKLEDDASAKIHANRKMNRDLSYEEKYKEKIDVENYIKNKDTLYLNWILTNREMLD